MIHSSDCAQHNEPAFEKGLCSCGGNNIEIERKFIVPIGAIRFFERIKDVITIEQHYIFMKKDEEVRFRKSISINKGGSPFCELTYKKGSGLEREEGHVIIPSHHFETFSKLQGIASVSKTRFVLSSEWPDTETTIDVFKSWDKALMEVEFASVQEANDFKPPHFVIEEVTDKKEWTNAQIALGRNTEIKGRCYV